jgi:hypothetical protein
MNARGSILNRTRQYMACEDGSVINGRSTQVINKVIQEMDEPTKHTGLKKNVDKT